MYFCRHLNRFLSKGHTIMGLFSSLFSSTKAEEDNDRKAGLKNFDILKYDGIQALRIGKAAYALKCFTEALKIQKDLETMKYMVTACNTLNNNDMALTTLNEMVAIGEEPVNTLLMRANFFFMMGKYAEAAADCEQIVEMEPDNFVAYFYLAKSESAVGNRTQAINYLDKATALKEDLAEGYTLRADIYLAMGKGNEALSDIEKVIELTPEDEAAYLLRGRIHEMMGNVEAASSDYAMTLEWNPFNETAYLLAGRLLMNQGKHDEVISLFSEAIEQIENPAKIYLARAFAKHQIGDHEGALDDEQTAGELNPEAIGKPDENPNFDNLYKGGIF